MKYILRHVKPAPEGIVWDVSKERNFEELLATNRESAPGPDRLPCSTCRHAGGIGTRFLFEAYQHLFRGGHPPTGFPASRTVLIWKSRDVDEAAQLLRAPHALRPSRCAIAIAKIITTAMCAGLRKYVQECIHQSQR